MEFRYLPRLFLLLVASILVSLVTSCADEDLTGPEDGVALDIRVRFEGSGSSAFGVPGLRSSAPLDTVRATAYEVGVSSETAKATSFAVIQPGDEAFDLSLTVPPALLYRVVVEALGQTSDLSNTQGIQYQGEALTEPAAGSNPPVEILLADVVPDSAVVKMDGTTTRLEWNRVDAARGYEIRRVDLDDEEVFFQTGETFFDLELETLLVSDRLYSLRTESRYLFQIRSILNRGAVSSYTDSLLVRSRNPETTDDLAASGSGPESISLTWTAPAGDARKGRVVRYDIRYADDTIETPEAFDAATPVPNPPTPANPGDTETFLVDGLTPGTTYYFALRALDDEELWSPISNSARASTEDAPVGGCCFDDGRCQLSTRPSCVSQSGNYQGDEEPCDPNPCPQPMGACCFENGDCRSLTSESCESQGGSFEGANTACDPNPCPEPMGACCFRDGSCQTETDTDCREGNGSYEGDGTSCDPNPCPQPEGACCLDDGSCRVETSVDCGGLEGSYQGDDVSCVPNPCPQPPTGACCFEDGGCIEYTASICATAAGGYLGDETVCDPNPCPQPPAACCLEDDSCVELTEAECLGRSGTYFGDGTDCTPTLCLDPTGACCFDDGICEIDTESACVTRGGLYEGDDTGCSPNPCPQPGACCFPGGICSMLLEDDCSQAEGVFEGAGSDCDPNPCPQIGACCFDDGRCEALTETECGVSEGSYLGDGVSCVPNNPCPQPGACCFIDGSCSIEFEDDCVSAQGTFEGAGTNCDPNPCPAAQGACCVSGICSVKTEADCLESGGGYQGDATGCDPDPCVPRGACCFTNGNCSYVSRDECNLAKGEFLDEGVLCDPNPCTALGACCFDDGNCAIGTEADCEGSEGVYEGDGSSCDPDPCPPAGACCFDDGSCDFKTEAYCAMGEGVYQGDGLICSPNPCAQPGACCFDDGYCLIDLESYCELSDGVFQGEGISCSPNPCPILGACCFDGGSCAIVDQVNCLEGSGVYIGDLTTCDPNPCLVDLEIREIELLPSSFPTCGDAIQVRARVWNNGPASSVGTTVRVKLDGFVECELTVPGLDPGTNAWTDLCDLPPLDEGTYDMHLEADPDAGQAEDDKLNNVWNEDLDVAGCPDLVVGAIEFNSDSPDCGYILMGRAYIENKGSGDAGISSTRFDLEGLLCTADVPGLEAGKGAWTEWCDFFTAPGSAVSLDVTADYLDQVPEKDEGNNDDSSIWDPIDCEGWSARYHAPPAGLGIIGHVNAFFEYDGELIAAGLFLDAGGIPVSNIAAFDGFAWSALGSGVNGEVFDLAVHNGKLIAGGAFSVAGGTSAANVAAWNGASWEAVGSGFNGPVEALEVYLGDLVAGGAFTLSGPTPLKSLARWDGDAWTDLGGGVAHMPGPALVTSLAIYESRLAVGGHFTDAGPFQTYNVAVFDNDTWIPLGEGVGGENDFVLALHGEGMLLYVGGLFTTAGPSVANNAAYWSGTGWSELGSGGASGAVHDLSEWDGYIIATGEFTTAGGSVMNRVAMISGQTWFEMDGGLDSPGYAIGHYDFDLFIGGAFHTAGGRDSYGVGVYRYGFGK